MTSTSRALTRFALWQHGLVTRTQAKSVGCSDEVLQRLCRDGSLQRLERGVYRFTNVPRSFEQRVLAACLAHSGAVACRLTAARLHGFEPDEPAAQGDTRPEILCRTARRQPREGGHVMHSSAALADADVVLRARIPTTSPARTLRDLAGRLPAPVVDRLLGHLLATRQLSAVQLGQLATAGTQAVRAAAVRAGAAVAPGSVLEHRALLLLRAAGLPEPAGQFPIHAGGRLVAVVDFAWPEELVVLEVDGYRWHGDPAAFANDRRRDNRLQELGWTVYRTSSSDLAQGAGPLLRQLGGALRVRRATSAG